MLSWLKNSPSGIQRLGPLESQLLRVLWKRGDGTVRELLDYESLSAAYTTVMTTLDRLYKKGLLDRSPDGRAFRYKPRQTEEEFNRAVLAAEVARLLNSAAHPAVPLSFLVETVTRHDAALLGELQRAVGRKRRQLRKKEDK
ncbi:MAG TPA: BlaI/MecI/CopY family transcriptional regulator [Candidatus Angelobacter sp.]|nr:BlaI/MecI/CopY family transcriptional regulator [Candidatus Angelobacter sp.]